MTHTNLARTCVSLAILFLATTITQAQSPEQIRQSFLKPEARETAKPKPRVVPARKEGERGVWRRNGPLSIASHIVYWGAVVADDLSTRSAIKNGASERNPILRTEGGYNRPLFYGISAGFDALTMWIERKHPKAAIWMRFGLGGGHIAVASLNSR